MTRASLGSPRGAPAVPPTPPDLQMVERAVLGAVQRKAAVSGAPQARKQPNCPVTISHPHPPTICRGPSDPSVTMAPRFFLPRQSPLQGSVQSWQEAPHTLMSMEMAPHLASTQAWGGTHLTQPPSHPCSGEDNPPQCLPAGPCLPCPGPEAPPGRPTRV